MTTVLLVDDDPYVRKSVAAVLERSGYGVVRAADGHLALDALDGAAPVDLVIADYRMPGMDGLALARRIRESRPGTPIILLTGYGDLESYLCAVNLGIFRYLRKPVKLRELQQAVQDALAGHACAGTADHEA